MAEQISPISQQMTPVEKTNLAELETTIQKNLTAFYEVGFSLMQIRDNKLYRESYTTFEAYCKERWGMTKVHAYRLISSAEVQDNLKSNQLVTPTSESVLRPLTRLPPDQQRQAYQKAVETAPEGKVTAKHVEKVVYKIKHPEMEIDYSQITSALTFSAMAISQLERISKDDPKRREALQEVIDWCTKKL